MPGTPDLHASHLSALTGSTPFNKGARAYGFHHKDIDNIVHYIAAELVNQAAAAGFLDDVEKSYHAVVNNPCMYSLCHDARLSREGYRKIVIKNYLILYRTDDEARAVFIVRIIYGGRNYVDFI